MGSSHDPRTLHEMAAIHMRMTIDKLQPVKSWTVGAYGYLVPDGGYDACACAVVVAVTGRKLTVAEIRGTVHIYVQPETEPDCALRFPPSEMARWTPVPSAMTEKARALTWSPKRGVWVDTADPCRPGFFAAQTGALPTRHLRFLPETELPNE